MPLSAGRVTNFLGGPTSPPISGVIREKYSPPDLLQSKNIVHGCSGLNLAYAIFTPQAKQSNAETSPLKQNESHRILLGVNFAYVDFTTPSKSCVLHVPEGAK